MAEKKIEPFTRKKLIEWLLCGKIDRPWPHLVMAGAWGLVVLVNLVWHQQVLLCVIAGIGIGGNIERFFQKKFRGRESGGAPACQAAQGGVDADADARRSAFHRVMFGRLLEEARRSALPVKIGIEARHHRRGKLAGVYVQVNKKPSHIALDPEFNHYLLLAHELGHHIAIQRRDDHSEEGADREGFRLIRSLLHDDERPFWEPIINSIEKELAEKR